MGNAQSRTTLALTEARPRQNGQRARSTEAVFAALPDEAGITINGKRPWDM